MATISIAESIVGKVDDHEVKEFVLSNGAGLSVRILSFGATITSIQCPDAAGKSQEVTLSFTSLEDVMSAKFRYMGSTVGRVCNRIARGKFSLEGKEYSLPINNGVNSLHGGIKGFSHRVWDTKLYTEGDEHGVDFSLVAEDGEEGYPGRLTVHARYGLAGNELRSTFTAEAEATTLINITNHVYWNLSGDLVRNIKDHELTLNADKFLPVDATQIPTGELKSVDGTPMDFRTRTPVGSRLTEVDGGGQPGYDHCFTIIRGEGKDGELTQAAELVDPTSGRCVTVLTTQPGIQLYTSNFLKGEHPLTQHNALCLETQHYPDAIHHDNFPSIVLKAGQPWRHVTNYVFSVRS